MPSSFRENSVFQGWCCRRHFNNNAALDDSRCGQKIGSDKKEKHKRKLWVELVVWYICSQPVRSFICWCWKQPKFIKRFIKIFLNMHLDLPRKMRQWSVCHTFINPHKLTWEVSVLHGCWGSSQFKIHHTDTPIFRGDHWFVRAWPLSINNTRHLLWGLYAIQTFTL